METIENELSHREFITHFSANHRKILSFVISISPNYADVDEIFQRVSLVLWQKWPTYVDEGKFLAWALQIARLEVVKFLSLRKRRREIFDDEILDLIQIRTSDLTDELSDRAMALQDCLGKLPNEQRTLVSRCYLGTEKIKEIAELMSIDPPRLYLRLQRIRKTLHQCIDRSLAQ